MLSGKSSGRRLFFSEPSSVMCRTPATLADHGEDRRRSGDHHMGEIGAEADAVAVQLAGQRRLGAVVVVTHERIRLVHELVARTMTSWNAARSSPPLAKRAGPERIGEPAGHRRKSAVKAMFAPDPIEPAVYGNIGSAGRFSPRSKTLGDVPLPKPAYASIHCWAWVSSSAGSDHAGHARHRLAPGEPLGDGGSQLLSTSTSSSVNATSVPRRYGSAALWARARPGRGSRTYRSGWSVRAVSSSSRSRVRSSLGALSTTITSKSG